MYLLIDDTRDLPKMDVIARNSKAGLKMLALGGWEGLLLDNDLGPDSQEGWEVLKTALSTDIFRVPDYVELVTSNPVARERMANMLVDAGYKKSADGVCFRRNVV